MKTLQVLAGVLVVFGAAARADLVETLNNTITDGTIVIDSSRDGWTGLTPYQIDPNEGSTYDWHQVTMANDSSNFYFRYSMNASAAFDFNLRIFLDTDLSRDSGFIGGESQFSIGAEYMIEGARLYAFSGPNQSTWGWTDLGMLPFNDSIANDYELSVGISALDTSTFNFLLFGTGTISGDEYRDYYVDSSNGGANGGYLQYTAVPEPGTTALAGMGLAAVLVWSRRKTRI